MNFLTTKLASYLTPKPEKYAIVMDFDAIEEMVAYIAFYRLNPNDEKAEEHFIEEMIRNYKQMRANLENERYHLTEDSFILYETEPNDDEESNNEHETNNEAEENLLNNILASLQNPPGHHPRYFLPLRRKNVAFWIHNFCEGWSGSAIIFKTDHHQDNDKWTSSYISDAPFFE